MRLVSKIAASICLVIVTSPAAFAFSVATSAERAPVNLRWKKSEISIAISRSITEPSTNIKADSDITGALARSLGSWQKAANVVFRQTGSETDSVSPAGAAGDGVSLITIAATAENVLFFGKDAEAAPARTRVFYDSQGYITEADIVLNPYQSFSTDGTLGTFDLESTLTHEIGHLLGLSHSSVLGATMNENYGKNGVYNLESTGARTLSATDISSVRTLYGAADAEECCGEINGRLEMAAGRAAKSFRVWAESADGNSVAAEAVTAADGTFHFRGLTAGKYGLFAQGELKPSTKFAAHEIGSVEVRAGSAVAVTGKMPASTVDFRVQYVGFNGQLSRFAVPLNAGRSYTVFLGGENLDAGSIRVGSESPHLQISQDSLVNHDYGKELSVVSFQISVNVDAPAGEYSIFVESALGGRRYAVGAISLEEFLNPWSSRISF